MFDRRTQEPTLPNDAAHTRKTTFVSTNIDFSFYLSVSLPLFVAFRVAKRSNQAAEPGEEEIILQLTSGGNAALCKWYLCTISQWNGVEEKEQRETPRDDRKGERNALVLNIRGGGNSDLLQQKENTNRRYKGRNKSWIKDRQQKEESK